MRYFYGVLLVLFLIVAGVVSTKPAAAPLPSAVVKVLVEGGKGTGVHIGNGYVLTATHVSQGSPVRLALTDGTEVAAETLWENKSYDIALLRTSAKMQAAPLACRTATVGERVTAHGNPLILDFVSSDGKVAGVAREFGPWKEVLPVDMTIVMGMSGGPTFDIHGNVVGINVGVLVAPMGFGASLTGFGAIVPSSVVCALMGRT